MPGKSINMAENRKHRKVVTFSFNYTYYDSYTDTINNFIQAIMEAAVEYNDNRPSIPSAKYDLNNTSVIELKEDKTITPEIKEENKEDGI